jgi:hypothetical protein
MATNKTTTTTARSTEPSAAVQTGEFMDQKKVAKFTISASLRLPPAAAEQSTP